MKGKKRCSKAERLALDTQRCLDFTMDVIELTSNFDSNETILAPVMYCGLHNPLRDETFFGLPPGGGAIVQSMRIPVQHKEVSTESGLAADSNEEVATE